MSLEHHFLLSSIFKVIHKKTRLLEAFSWCLEHITELFLVLLHSVASPSIQP